MLSLQFSKIEVKIVKNILFYFNVIYIMLQLYMIYFEKALFKSSMYIFLESFEIEKSVLYFREKVTSLFYISTLFIVALSLFDAETLIFLLSLF